MQNYINALIFTKNKSEEMLTFSLHSAIVVDELDWLTEGHRLGAGEDQATGEGTGLDLTIVPVTGLYHSCYKQTMI